MSKPGARSRLSRVMRARLGYFAGVVIVAVGVFLAAGLGWALVVAGLAVMAAFVWLYDVSDPDVVEVSDVQRREELW